MEINVKKIGKNWIVEFTHGCQTFTIDYHAIEKDEADWVKDRLTDCFRSAFGENWHEHSGLNIPPVSGMCECINPVDAGSDYPDVLHKCSKCGPSID